MTHLCKKKKKCIERFPEGFFIKKIVRWDLALISLSFISFSILFYILIKAVYYFSFRPNCKALFVLGKASTGKEALSKH